MTGYSIAARDAAPWVTDFLNAAYYRRAVDDREVDDLRFAFCVLTTYWYNKDTQRRLHVNDLLAFHKAFGAERFHTDAVGARDAVARAAGGGRGEADRRLVPGGLPRRRAARLGDRVRDGRRPRGLQPGAPARPGQARGA